MPVLLPKHRLRDRAEAALKAGRFNEADHPRDAHGRFIRTGDNVTLSSGVRGTVVSLNDGGKVKVRTARGETVRVDPKQLGAATSRESTLSGMQPATPAQRKALSLPPAWTDVLVHPDVAPGNTNPDGVKILAVGRDAKGREQRVYSSAHAEEQSAKKFERVRQLATAGPQLDSHLKQRADANDSAGALLLIRRLGLRPGSTTDTGADKQAYGASTLEARHVTVANGTATLHFTGKKGVDISLETSDPQVVGLLERKLHDSKSPSDRLFPTATDQSLRDELQGVLPGFKVKDLRTLVGTGEALKIVGDAPPPEPPDPADERAVKRAKLEVAKRVSALLGNTPSVALESYIDPTVFGRWEQPVPATKTQAAGPGVWDQLVLDHAAGVSFFPPLPAGLPDDPDPEPEDVTVAKVGERRYVRDRFGRFSEIPGGAAMTFPRMYRGREARKLPNPRKRYGEPDALRAAGRAAAQGVQEKRRNWMQRRAASMLQSMPANHPERPYWIGVAEASAPAPAPAAAAAAPDAVAGGLPLDQVAPKARSLVEGGAAKARRDGKERYVYRDKNGAWQRKHVNALHRVDDNIDYNIAAYHIDAQGRVSIKVLEEDPGVKLRRELKQQRQDGVDGARIRAQGFGNNRAAFDDAILIAEDGLQAARASGDERKAAYAEAYLNEMKQRREALGTEAVGIPSDARRFLLSLPPDERQAAVDAWRREQKPGRMIDNAAIQLADALAADGDGAFEDADKIADDIGDMRARANRANVNVREGGANWADLKVQAMKDILGPDNVEAQLMAIDVMRLDALQRLAKDPHGIDAELRIGILNRLRVQRREITDRQARAGRPVDLGEHPASSVRVPGDEPFLDHEITDIRNLGGGINTTKKGKIRGKAVIVKPLAGAYAGQARANIPKKSDPQRERGAYLIARELGIPVPTTVVRHVEGEGVAVVQDFQVAKIAMNASHDEDRDVKRHPDFRRIGLFDAVIGNTDRHGGNWMVKKDDAAGHRPIAIDHGLALPIGKMGSSNSQIQDQVASGVLGDPTLTDTELEELRALRAKDELYDQLAKSGLEPGAIDSLKQRIDIIIRMGKIPSRSEIDAQYR